MDTGTDDDDDDEDGQITKYEEEEERDRKRFGKSEPDDEPITVEDLNKCRISRGLLAKHCMAPWFDEYIKDMSSCLTCSKELDGLYFRAQKGRGYDILLGPIEVNPFIAFVRSEVRPSCLHESLLLRQL